MKKLSFHSQTFKDRNRNRRRPILAERIETRAKALKKEERKNWPAESFERFRIISFTEKKIPSWNTGAETKKKMWWDVEGGENKEEKREIVEKHR